MTILQLDSVNVLCRSHFLPLFARLGAYDRDQLDRWIWWSGENLEYLAHEASITSVELRPLLRERMKHPRWNGFRTFEEKHPDYVRAVHREVTELGPLSVKDLSDPGGRTGPWWGQSKGKMCLEVHYVGGRLAIRERTPTFLTVYDIPERVVPDHLLAMPDLDPHEAERQMLMLGARSHGVGTATDLADYFRLRMPVARPRLAELVEAGQLEPVNVEGWKEPAYLHPEAKRPRSVSARALLSPFDPVVWFRPRALRLFDFTYRIEIYVPEKDRVHGYYVLPFLLGDRLVARVDLKADRANGRLLVRGAFLEPGHDAEAVASELGVELGDMARWLGLDEIELGHRGDLIDALQAAVDRAAA